MSEIVPDGWNKRTFRDSVSLEYGKSPKGILDDDGPYPVIGTSGVTGRGSAFLFDGASTVVGRKGTIDKPLFVEGRFWTIDTAYYLRGYKETDPKWFYYRLVSADLSKFNEATGVPSLNRDTFYSIQYLHPPLPEQQKIAAILTSVDNVIEKTEVQISKLQDLKKGMMQELLTKGIGHTEFKDSPYGRVPSDWRVCELREFLTTITYGFTNPMPESESGPYMITAKDVIEGRVVYESARRTSQDAYDSLLTNKSRPQVGDVLLTKDGTLGRVALVDRPGICVNQSVAVLRLKNSISVKFVKYLLESPPYQRKMLDDAGGTTIKHIYITVVDKMVVAVPKERSEQDKIVEILDSLNSRIMLSENKADVARSMKKALMQDLLAGKVRVKVP